MPRAPPHIIRVNAIQFRKRWITALLLIALGPPGRRSRSFHPPDITKQAHFVDKHIIPILLISIEHLTFHYVHLSRSFSGFITYCQVLSRIWIKLERYLSALRIPEKWNADIYLLSIFTITFSLRSIHGKQQQRLEHNLSENIYVNWKL